MRQMLRQAVRQHFQQRKDHIETNLSLDRHKTEEKHLLLAEQHFDSDNTRTKTPINRSTFPREYRISQSRK
jgi:hypothetical protein